MIKSLDFTNSRNQHKNKKKDHNRDENRYQRYEKLTTNVVSSDEQRYNASYLPNGRRVA